MRRWIHLANETCTNLVWMDLEMTGLDPDIDLIIETATIITDEELNVIAEGPNLVINVPAGRFDMMDDWNQKQHTKSGLWQKVLDSKISLIDAEKETLAFIKQHVPANAAALCGNSIWQDRRFIRKHMPQLDSYLHYRMVDVSTVKELCKRWYSDCMYPDKVDAHRALDDIVQSIEELKHYRKYIFRQR